jgi:phosphoribosylanthranilate isomerase
MNVKICGVTTVEDALMCAEAGADLIGLNFYPKSPRYLSREAATAITTALRALPKPLTLVGVFVNETAETMNAVLDECNIDLAQLSGDESDDVLDTMGERGFKAIRKHPDAMSDSSLLLLDAHAAGMYGGTGKTVDWGRAAGLAKQCRLLLAGGLTPENVAAAVTTVRPWGVDVASGVESSPGVKDPVKVVSFIRNAKNC